MPHWTDAQSEARKSVATTLDVVDQLLSYMSEGRGKPSTRERAIFAAAIVFSYGVWESYIEELAIEVSGKLSGELDPGRVPEHVRKSLESHTAWELNVHPGWRSLWERKVTTAARGEGESYGLNTAKTKQVVALLKVAGVGDIFGTIPSNIVPPHLVGVCNTAASAVDKLVALRGEIVHSGAVPETLLKHHAKEWRQFVEALVKEVDGACLAECKTLLG